MMPNLHKSVEVVFVSTYPPRECGLATFTEDLLSAMEKGTQGVRASVVAMTDSACSYDAHVRWEIIQQDRASYHQAAQSISQSSADVVILQHEFGIFGGPYGEYILEFADALTVPLITILHTVLPEPLPEQKHIIQRLAEQSQRIVTMAHNTLTILKQTYEVPEAKLTIIGHGIPRVHVGDGETLKKQYGLQNHRVMSTFGLIGPGKGIEYAIDAVAQVVQSFPDLIYLIIGQTHPDIIKKSGEWYRTALQDQVQRLGLTDHVRFVNQYLTQAQIAEYLQLSDVYITPYLDKNQAVSGTLAYAVGYGKMIVSTPYIYAMEMLDRGRGLLVSFRNADAIASALLYAFHNPEAVKMMEARTKTLGRSMMWDRIAERYTVLLTEVIPALVQ